MGAGSSRSDFSLSFCERKSNAKLSPIVRPLFENNLNRKSSSIAVKIETVQPANDFSIEQQQKSKPKSMKNRKLSRKSSLPPLEKSPSTQILPTTRVLPFKEYKKWLSGLRSAEVSKTPVTPLNSGVRCQTATFRIRRLSDVSESSEGTRSASNTSGESGVFDLQKLGDALSRPKNKVCELISLL